MPIFKIQRMSDKKYLGKRYWRNEQFFPKVWEDVGNIFVTINELYSLQKKLTYLTRDNPREEYNVITYDLENMTKIYIPGNRMENLNLGDRLKFSFLDFLPLTKQAKLLKLGFKQDDVYDVVNFYSGFRGRYKTNPLNGTIYNYDAIEFHQFRGILLPYFLFSKV